MSLNLFSLPFSAEKVWIGTDIMMYQKISFFGLIVVLAACQDKLQLDDLQETSQASEITDEQSSKTLLKSSTLEDLEPFARTCPSDMKEKKCYSVCLVPDSRLELAKNRIFSFEELTEHLEKRRENMHQDKDYLGKCSSESGAEITKVDAYDPNEDAEANNQVIDCDPIFEDDLDCDGYDDFTGESL